ncbi:hypothetical protein KUV95_03500 [Microbulbifer agarilyticus]|uniref:hypothetical protein n=1 Tax=Microbulbifer agarilyticus TaxID=260552 RepID=UPI001C967FE6|nr:hypothetical protein [Microbulbifer agarilyticus]MBY6210603.1 hypothetical protein [Microbulbifer agarilyticus]
MKRIFCAYYDEESEQDVPLQPTLNEAVSLFRRFNWENFKEESTLKSLVFQAQTSETSSLSISRVDESNWCVSASASNRRRFLGPFFKQHEFSLFLDKGADEVEELLRIFYQSTVFEFYTYLKSTGE